MKNDAVVLLVLLFLFGCSGQSRMPGTPTPSLTQVFLPTSTEAATAPSDFLPSPTVGQWLPYNPNSSDQGCGAFIATLPSLGTNGLSQEEIFRRLFDGYLAHFRSPDLGSDCRLENYRVENVIIDSKIAFLAGEQKVDQVAWVIFSVQVTEVPTEWIAGNGELAAQGWVSHKSLIVGFTKSSTNYTLKLIGTGP
jgi:hypothetical protein